MKHGTALIIKFLMVAVVLEIVLNLMTNLTFGSILVISLVVTIIAYIAGDLLILPATNNTVATAADIVLALIIIYMFNLVWRARVVFFIDALVAAAVLGAGEWLFHKYVAKTFFPQFKE